METLLCWFNSITPEDIKNILISIPGIFLGGFTFYFAYQKIGTKVLVSYEQTFSRITERRISSLELINEKNKPISIFSVHAVLNKDVIIELNKYSPPIILKPLESLQLTMPAFSGLYLGGERYKADYLRPNKVDIYLITYNKKIKCKTIDSPDLNAFFDFKHLRQTNKNTRTFNGKVYNEAVKYAITYSFNSKEYTALVEDWGFITEDWGFKYNQIPSEYMGTKDTVKEYLVSLGYDKFFDALQIDDVD